MKPEKKASIFLFVLKIIIKFVMDILYPTKCIICGSINENIICNNCYKNYIYKKIIKECKILKYNDKNFNKHLYLFDYDGKIRKIIIDYKFNDRAYLRDFFIKIILKNKKICRKIKKYDIIIPVPIHKKRKKERGYNQSGIIARKIAENFYNIKYNEKCLIKQKNTVQQSKLNLEQRKQNVKKVYKIKNIEKIKNKKIILFDDIYTTGSTVNECARILKENGAKEILVLTLAKD